MSNNDIEHARIKVNKGVSKETRILNLRLPYLGVMACFVLLGVVLLLINFSFNVLVLIVIISIIIYMILQFLDGIDFFSNFNKSTIPDEFINDIY